MDDRLSSPPAQRPRGVDSSARESRKTQTKPLWKTSKQLRRPNCIFTMRPRMTVLRIFSSRNLSGPRMTHSCPPNDIGPNTSACNIPHDQLGKSNPPRIVTELDATKNPFITISFAPNTMQEQKPSAPTGRSLFR
ncbi:hypothetical protein CERZMDRAFT_86392 [Cercospora zeae-maydis SCOH1-5]|uniref:Uncharacterized protein n=1 Tax=Cercospora zeae-maydis SCOH1-5 TaxID=717836 RepID=A0A6A6F9L2_9PEZI|nr:hypothetical protein CERZMDRAFT_86392 [Cercospora zeae-maydis SCOH1-5]